MLEQGLLRVRTVATETPRRFRYREIMACRPKDSRHSGLILAARMTFPHFSVSSAMSFPKSAGEPAVTVTPQSASRAFSLGSASPALISLLSLLTTSTGVPLGAAKPNHALDS